MTARIKLSYKKGVKNALEKIAMGGFGDMLSSMGKSVSGAFKNPNRAKVEAASGGSSSGNLGTDISKLISKDPAPTTPAVTSTGG